MSQITLRALDPRVEAELRRRADDQHSSLSEVANLLLLKAIGLEESSGKKRNLRDMPGRWSQEEADAFEATQVAFGIIDEDVWR
ncbi:MAG: hypothetical protein WCQ50_11145 [Spirochaetota bacterium]